MIRRWAQSIFVKFSAAFIVVGLIPLIALSFFAVHTYTNFVERHTINNTEQMLNYLGLSLDDTFKAYNELTKLMYFGNSDGEISELDRIVKQKGQDWVVQRQMEDYLQRLLLSDRFIRNIFFVRASDGKLFYQSRGTSVLRTTLLPINEWMKPLRSEPKQLAIIPTHPQSYFAGNNLPVVTLGRNLIDTSGSIHDDEIAILGTLFMDIDIRMFKEMTSELSLNEEDKLYFLDRDRNVFYTNIAGFHYPGKAAPITNDDTLVLAEPVAFFGGSVTLVLSEKALYRELTQTQFTVWVAIALCSLALIAMSTLFSRKLSRPILGIMKEMSKVESGNLQTKIPVTSKDEIGRLAHGFNRMVERLSSFIEVAYVAELKRKQTELNALKSQIRPHYLYNTLEVIRMNAVANDDAEVGEMIRSLSKQLQYVIDYGEEWVSLERELGHLADYFFIIHVRYEGRIELRVSIQEGIDMQWPVLKLSLQPIVENAIQHGIRPKGGRGVVQVSVETAEDALSVTIFDDGIGMDTETMGRVVRTMNDRTSSVKSVGMRNVQERMKSVCGERYGIEISSQPYVGTSVRLLFPLKGGGDPDSSRIGG
ncbi:sensor histidine kinase [Paenibacillus sp.]|uniref:cache domain-containing sensor histidine kinase n=1 Tax=Paenibacillus sp. TaxID=58172 RepID=UPI002D2C90C7|nr:sensor histidine kinase [Paenibacillus sp.]HZG88002.1 sensor histidine kinase [Paenibacillus sp.]